MKWLTIPISYGLIIASGVLGITAVAVSEWKDDFVLSVLLYILLAVLPYFLGWYILDRRFFKKEFWPRFRILTGVTVFAPVIFMSYDRFFDLKHEMVSHPADIYLDSRAIPELMAGLVTFAFTIFLISFLSIYILWFDIRKSVYLIPIISLLCIAGVWHMSEGDFKAIREDGIVISLQDTYEEIPWSEVEQAYLNSAVKYSSGSGGTSDYVWTFIFQLKNGEDIPFGPFVYHKKTLKHSLAIKKKIMDEKIPISLEALTEDDWYFVKLDIESEKDANVEDFYSLIQYNPETGEYYSVPYD